MRFIGLHAVVLSDIKYIPFSAPLGKVEVATRPETAASGSRDDSLTSQQSPPFRHGEQTDLHPLYTKPIICFMPYMTTAILPPRFGAKPVGQGRKDHFSES